MCWAWHLFLDHLANAVDVIRFARQHDGAGTEMVEQPIGDLPVMRLLGGQAEPDRGALCVADDMDFGREPAA